MTPPSPPGSPFPPPATSMQINPPYPRSDWSFPPQGAFSPLPPRAQSMQTSLWHRVAIGCRSLPPPRRSFSAPAPSFSPRYPVSSPACGRWRALIGSRAREAPPPRPLRAGGERCGAVGGWGGGEGKAHESSRIPAGRRARPLPVRVTKGAGSG